MKCLVIKSDQSSAIPVTVLLLVWGDRLDLHARITHFQPDESSLNLYNLFH